MPTVQHLVKQEIEKNPFLIDILEQNLINISALAEKIQPFIEKELKKKIKLSAVSMAIRRYTQQISKSIFFNGNFLRI